MNVTKIDYVVATHPDADHIGGLADVINAFTVGEFINSGKVHTSKTYENLLQLVLTKDIKYTEIGAKAYSTAQDGTITIKTNGSTYSNSAKVFTAPTTQHKPIPVEKPVEKPVTEQPKPTKPAGDINSGTYVIPGAPTTFKNCTEMREYYPSGVSSSHPAYKSSSDRDKDGWACER